MFRSAARSLLRGVGRAGTGTHARLRQKAVRTIALMPSHCPPSSARHQTRHPLVTPHTRPPRRTMFIQTQPTPNAQAVMFMPGRDVMPNGRGTADFPTLRSASSSPLARKLFGISGVRSIFFGADFVTVTKDDAVDWAVLRPEIFEVIMEFFTDDSQPVIVADESNMPDADTIIRDDDNEVVAMIKELLETRVKPAVAEDGGSILYRGFDEDTGVVKLELQGACSTCSSSSVTLKSGVENMMRHYIPEVKAVEEVFSNETSEIERANRQAFSEVEKKLSDSGILRP